MSYHTNSAPPTYDHALLSSARDLARAANPEEYDVGLLDECRDRRAPTPPNGAPSDSNRPTTLGHSPGAAGNARSEDSANGHEPLVKKVPWYRTRWGIGVIALITFIVAGIAGGVVAGTHKRTTSSSETGQQQQQTASPGPSQTPTQGQQQQASPWSTIVSTAVNQSVQPSSTYQPQRSSTMPSTSASTTTEQPTRQGSSANPQ